jgi:hypothetical protein
LCQGVVFLEAIAKGLAIVVGNMATAEMTQMIKVVIDGNRLFMLRTDAGTQKLKHRRCNTNANTDAATQMRAAATQMQTQTLKHSAETELEHRS